MHSAATIITHGIGSAGITTSNAGVLSEIISSGDITTDATATTTNLGVPVAAGTYSAGISLTNRSTIPGALAHLIVNGGSTVQTAGPLSPAAFVAAYQTADIDIDTRLGRLISTGDDSPGLVANSVFGDLAANVGNINAAGRYSQGVVAASSFAGVVDVTIARGAVVEGGWQQDTTSFSTRTGLPSAGVVIGGGLLQPSSLTNNGTIGALSDRAIISADLFTRVPSILQPFPAGTFSLVGGSLKVTNNGQVAGFVKFGSGEFGFDNFGIFDARHFADSNGDGIRNVERVAVSDFGANAATQFTNAGALRVATVTGPRSVDPAGQYVPAGLAGGYQAAVYDAGISGVEQAQFLNLPTFINTGIITMQDGETGGSGPVAGDVLVISGGGVPGSDGGGIFRTGGQLHLDAVLNQGSPAHSIADVLVVNSTDSSDGPMLISIANAGGAGAATDLNKNGRVDEGEGILVVEVLNASQSASDAFALSGPVVGGVWKYDLFWGAAGGDWYLNSVGFQAGVPVYEAYGQALLGQMDMPTLQQRVGNRYWSGEGNVMIEQGDGPGVAEAGPSPGGSAAIQGNGIWGRIVGRHGHYEPDVSTSGTEYDADLWQLQAGIDGVLHENDDGDRLIGGITANYGQASTDIFSAVGDGDIDTKAYGIGATATWYQQNGFYIDAQAQATWFDSDLASDTLGALADGNDGFGYALSVETGKRIAVKENWTVTPQAQLVYADVDIDDFTGPSGEAVSLSDGDSLLGRLGLAIDREASWNDDGGRLSRSHVYGIGNLRYEFYHGTVMTVSGTDLFNENDGLWGELGLGGSLNWHDDKYSIYGEGSVMTSLADFGDSYALKGTAGFRVKW